MELEMLYESYLNNLVKLQKEHPLSEDAYYYNGCMWGLKYAICVLLGFSEADFEKRIKEYIDMNRYTIQYKGPA